MSLETEAAIDRRRLRRRLGFWRILAIIGVVAAVGAALVAGRTASDLVNKGHIARVALEGIITNDRRQVKMLWKIAEDDNAKALLVFVNSPGGTTTGGEAIFEALRGVAEKKPVVAQFGTVAASAGYMVGLGGDHIVARGNTITGSVGVLFQWAEVSELLGKLGIKFNEVKSGNLKAEPTPFKPINPEGRRVAEQMVAESQKWFLGLVRERRKLDTATIPGLEAGRVYSGREALSHKLIDEIGGERQAIKWLETKAKVPAGLAVVNWQPKAKSHWGWSVLGGAVIEGLLGRESTAIGQFIQNTTERIANRLDGLVSVWQPSEN